MICSSDENIIESEKKNNLSYDLNLSNKTESNQVKDHITTGREILRSWLNRSFRIVMTDGRILIGVFLCTDADANVILGMCSEYTEKEREERILGLVMVPGRHIVSMEVDMSGTNSSLNNQTDLNDTERL